jgi:Domain of unknown function (DUF4440)
MKQIFIILIQISIFVTVPILASSQNKQVQQIERRLESLRQLMIQPEAVNLEHILHDSLSYGHSSGMVESKSSLMNNLLSGTSDFITIDITEQHISVHDHTAIVRHRLSATTLDKGVAGQVNLKVLLVWVKVKSMWKLAARQAVKVNV